MSAERLEYLRAQIRAECISQGEVLELQGLADEIEPGDVELLEWAGVPEDVAHVALQQRRRATRVREIMRQHSPDDSWDGDLCDDVPGDHKRWLLVERNQGAAAAAQPVYLSTHDSPHDVEEYSLNQEYPHDWHPIAVVNLDTGEVHQIEVVSTFEFDPAIEPEIVQTVPHPERAENRPCFGCGKEIQAGQLYLVKAPFHIRCAPKENP